MACKSLYIAFVASLKLLNSISHSLFADEDSSETRNALTDSLEKAVDQIDQVLEDANESDAGIL